MSQLIVEHITKKFGSFTAVDNVSFTVENGELLTIVGPSGCGKTTMLRMIAGFIEPTEGMIVLGGATLSDQSRNMEDVPPEKRNIGMVFQSYAVWPHMNIFNNVAYPLKLRKLPKAEIEKRVIRMLKIVHLSGYEKRMAYELSGGQQQRVALARALVMNPQLLLLDEPLSNLDAALREEMRSEIKELQHTMGITIINVTHDQIEAMTMSDKVAVMQAGKLIQYGTPQTLYENPANTFVAHFIGSANIIPATRTDEGADAEGMMRVCVNGDTMLKVPYKPFVTKEGFISVRAHHLHPDDCATLMAKVERRLYQGNQFEYFLRLKYGVVARMLTGVETDLPDETMISLTMKKAVWLDE